MNYGRKNRFFVVFVLFLFMCSGAVFADDVPVAAISTGVDNLDVNLYEGDFTFSIPLGSIPGRGGLGFGVGLNYVSDVYKIVHKDNSKIQASEVGLGFNLGGSYSIHRDPGATINDQSDDYFYMNLPGLGSNRLVKISENIVNPGDEWYREYKTEEDSYAKIEEYFVRDWGMVHPVFIVTTIDGTKYYFTHQRNTVAFNYDSEYEPYIVSTNPMNWFSAREWCNVQGGSMACPNTLSKDTQIRETLGSERVGWLGLFDSNGNGCWDDECALDEYDNWNSQYGEPHSECIPGTDNNPFNYTNTDGGVDGHWMDTDNPGAIATHAVCNAGIGGREASDKIEFVYQWDLEKIVDVSGNEINLNFRDEIFEVDESPYTKSYLESITDEVGNRIDIIWSEDREDVYYGDIINGEDPANSVKDYFVTNVITTGPASLGLGVMSSWHFEYDYVNDDIWEEDNVNKKLILTSLTYQGDDGSSLPPYVFSYTEEEDVPGIGYIDEVLYPTGARASLEYEEKLIEGMIVFQGDYGWGEGFELPGGRGIGDDYCDSIDHSPVDCINYGCYWKNSVERCEMDEIAITGFRIKSKTVDDGLGISEDVVYNYENALLHLEKKRQKYIGHDKVTIDYPAGFGSTVKEFCNNRGSCGSCDEVSSAKLDRFMFSSETKNEDGTETVASSSIDICPVVTYEPADAEPLDIIENPDFQDWTGGVPDGWTKVKYTSPSCSDYDLNEFILGGGDGYVKMRTSRYYPSCFYLKQTIDVEAGELYYINGSAKILDQGYGYPNVNWRIKVYDGDEEIGSRSGNDEVWWHNFYMYDLVSSSGTMEIRMFPHASDVDGVDFQVWNAYKDLKIFNSAEGGDIDGVTYDLRVSSQSSMTNGISKTVSYDFYDEYNGLPMMILEHGSSGGFKETLTFYAHGVYGGMEENNMLSQVYQTIVKENTQTKRDSHTTWSDSSEVWRPYESHLGVGDASQFVSRINSYDEYGNILEVEDAKGHVTKIYYGNNGECDNSGTAFAHSLPTCVEDNAGNEVKTFYTNKLMLDHVIDVNGGETSYSYDPFNRLWGVSTPDGGSVTNGYGYALEECGYLSEEDSCLNYITSEVDMGNGLTMNSISYSDGLARNIQSRVVKDSENALVSYVDYNEISKVSEITEPKSEPIGRFKGMIYPLLGSWGDDLAKKDLLKYREGDGDSESVKNFYYDDPLGRVEKVFPLTLYDEGDEFLEEECSVLGCNYYSYGGSGTTTITDLKGNQVSSTIDSFGNTVHEQDEILSIDYEYDVFGQLWGVTRNGVTENLNQYNSLGQLIWTYNIDSGESSFEYDENGNLEKTFVYGAPDGFFGNEDGQEVLYEFKNFYDNLDRVFDVMVDDNGDDIFEFILHNTYDNCNNGAGRICEIYNYLYGNGISYSYDSMGRTIGVVEYIDDGEDILSMDSSYNYDLAGNLIGISTYYNGESSDTNYRYNNLGQLDMVTVDGEEVDYAYTDLGMIDYIAYPNNVVSDYSYNERNWIEGIEIKNPDEETGQTYFHESYEDYDNVGNLESINDLYAGGIASFTYDDAYRLTDFSGSYYGVGNVHYDIDAFGNRQLRDVDGESDLVDSVDYYYEAGTNRLLGIDVDFDAHMDCLYYYDDVGNMISKDCSGEETFYHYDVSNMISRIDLVNEHYLEFEYDALGRRVKKYYSGDDSTTYYFYGLGINPLIEHRLGGESGSCGNGFLDAGEVCDDGNNDDCDGCKGDCTRWDNVCDDGLLECGERCDSDLGCPVGKWCSADCMSCLKDTDTPYDISEVLHGGEDPL
jgi:hypothetical protein